MDKPGNMEAPDTAALRATRPARPEGKTIKSGIKFTLKDKTYHSYSVKVNDGDKDAATGIL